MRNQNTQPLAGNQDMSDRQALRLILRENVARLLYDGETLGDGPQYEDIDQSIRAAWLEDARAAQRLVDPNVRAALAEIIAQSLANDRGLDWPRLSNLGIQPDPAWDPDTTANRIELHRIEMRQKIRHMARVALGATFRHLRTGGNDKHPHLDADVVKDAQAQQAEDELRTMTLKPKPKPAFGVIDGGRQ